jgi:GTP-binding protein
MFVDKVQVVVKAGDGGDGALSFRHEKFIDKGGPDGGDGGDGGSVVLVASRNQNTLTAFRYQREIKADPGKPGFKQRKHGRSGADMLVPVPVGTVVLIDDEPVADLNQDGKQVVVAKGGKGGFGNAHFVSSVRQAPRVAEKGEEGEEFEATLELKMIADVGLVGLPNAGKSTLLATISNARPEIANYPFTTIRPNLGMVDIDGDTSLLFADIPGLIEGASEGKGLGDEFLRHVERTTVLVHLIDIYNEDVVQAYQSKMGVKELLYAVKELVANEHAKQAEIIEQAEELPVLKLEQSEQSWTVTKQDSGFVVKGRKIEKFAARTDFDNVHGTQRLRDIMKKMGILHELRRQGIQPGNTIHIGKNKLTF